MRSVALFSLALVVAAPAFAQQASLDKVYACTGMADDAARLACFDAAVAGLKTATETGDAVVVNRAQIEKAEKEAFGLAAPTLSALAESAAATAKPMASTTATTPAAKPKALENVNLAVKAIDKGADGRYRFIMENGQVWRQSDDLKLAALGKGPWTAEIRKAAIGTFMLKLGDRTAVRVKRLE
jgi:hypothetical protein